MESLTLAQLLDLSPYGLFIIFAITVYRFLTGQVWPWYQKQDTEKQLVLKRAIDKLHELHTVVMTDRTYNKDQHIEILHKLDDIEAIILNWDKRQ